MVAKVTWGMACGRLGFVVGLQQQEVRDGALQKEA